MRWFAIFAAMASGLSACWPWSSEDKLHEGGETPFMHCLAAPPPAAGSSTLGRVRLAVSGRDLQLTAAQASPPLRLAVFSGAGFVGPPGAAALTRLRATQADVLLWVGGIGDSQATVEGTLHALASLARPVLLILGGRDSWRFSRDAISAMGAAVSVIDATSLRRISLGSSTLVPVGGAMNGRYALDATRCGFAQRDLDDAAAALGATRPGEQRWLVSWESAGSGTDGTVELARFAARIGAVGTLSPGLANRAPVQPTTLVVPRLFGPKLERPDGSHEPNGVLVLDVDATGLRVARDGPNGSADVH
jgi:hypothetical protein